MASPLRTSAERRAVRSPAVRRTLGVILLLNCVVVAIKIAVGVRTGALSVLGAALESALDVMNNVIGITLVRVAGREPDEDHPYGHDKFETLGALAVVGFLSISCFELLREGIIRLIQHESPRAPSAGEIAALIATTGINAIVVWYERKRGHELASPLLLADATHTSSDIYVTALAVLSLLLARAGVGSADPFLAIVVALVIAWAGWRVLRETVPVLVDQRAVDAEQIRELLRTIPRITDVRGIRSRSTASGVVFAEVTIGVDANTSVAEAHELADAAEARISELLGSSEVTVHVEPA